MKVFISWSGQRSNKVAQLFNWWLPSIIQAVKPWLSSNHIDGGSVWFNEISSQLAETTTGIICLTKSNKDKPWILFESGALAKGLAQNRVCTFLIDLESTDIKDPLAQFNHTTCNQASLLKLVRSINATLKENKLNDDILKRAFDTFWPQFEEEFKKILEETPDEDIKIEREDDDMLKEILTSVRGMEHRLRRVESDRKIAAYSTKGYYKYNIELRALKAIQESNIHNAMSSLPHIHGLSYSINDVSKEESFHDYEVSITSPKHIKTLVLEEAFTNQGMSIVRFSKQ